MANTKSASKRARQTVGRTLRNRTVRTRLRSLAKRVVASAKTETAAADVRSLVSALDKAAKRGIIHPNTASRRKSRLNKALAAQAKAGA